MPQLLLLTHLSTFQGLSCPLKKIPISMKKIYITELVNDFLNPTFLCACHTSQQDECLLFVSP